MQLNDHDQKKLVKESISDLYATRYCFIFQHNKQQ